MFRQAITTKFLGTTNSRGARVKATCDAATLTVQWDHSLNVERNHAAAAEALALQLGWSGAWVGGGMRGAGYAFVLADGAAFTVPASV